MRFDLTGPDFPHAPSGAAVGSLVYSRIGPAKVGLCVSISGEGYVRFSDANSRSREGSWAAPLTRHLGRADAFRCIALVLSRVLGGVNLQPGLTHGRFCRVQVSRAAIRMRMQPVFTAHGFGPPNQGKRACTLNYPRASDVVPSLNPGVWPSSELSPLRAEARPRLYVAGLLLVDYEQVLALRGKNRALGVGGP